MSHLKARVAITVDVETHGSVNDYTFAKVIDELVKKLAESDTKVTFFVNGSVLPRWSRRLVELHAAGHDVGSHGWNHQALIKMGHRAAREDMKMSFGWLSETLATSNIGYRAPYFSVTNETPWAPDAICESGFKYSSSVLPGKSNQYAFRGAPRGPFRWSNGLVEFPVPVIRLPGFSLPAIGGGYLRLLPSFVVSLHLLLARQLPMCWTYCHPYDFDGSTHLPQSPGFLLQRVIGRRRALMLPRILGIVDPTATRFSQALDAPQFRESLPIFRNEHS